MTMSAHFGPEAVLIAFGLGALHALEPGHGKTALLVYMMRPNARLSPSSDSPAACFPGTLPRVASWSLLRWLST